ncbi:hypothetical protein MYCTH_2124711 [Thermothelomyces thermophilus ATCC 42464]|uniref:Uncharacterized protein n=1 Tax=Thermothelomyces thermophilus (strain ATCC 42464 / BCRC 31852 / DSM 1799) TaxID=573729 RepID=G2Q082_THET4|nr:uncharacterized protein MYCTH_2124711 [Thermothelomyces thermophilus ATCC 42464]AEO55756.1 hypothetical protein MYCTH_2124711 [Thermothelomyces thermophilus ATCC 42464]
MHASSRTRSWPANIGSNPMSCSATEAAESPAPSPDDPIPSSDTPKRGVSGSPYLVQGRSDRTERIPPEVPRNPSRDGHPQFQAESKPADCVPTSATPGSWDALLRR